jgi:glycosyltransferase involved in cell wall biosynthesis
MVSIIVTSYNQAKTLELLFGSLDRQTFKNFEVIIADDGSSDHTSELCQQPRTFPLRFVTQPDLGYRKSKILNQAIRCASFDYLIFLDADVILEKHFVQDHLSLRKPGHFVCGRRVDLGPEISKKISLQHVRSGRFDRIGCGLVLSALKKDTVHLKRAMRLSQFWIRNILGYHHPVDLLGSNFSIWKSDLTSVNGFNEDMESYWGEDGDLFIRLRNMGKISIGAKSICIQYHVYHHRRTPTQENVDRYQSLLNDHSYKWAPKGYSDSVKK